MRYLCAVSFQQLSDGGPMVYNLWSIIHCIHKKGVTEPYWVNTSGNDVIRDLIIVKSRLSE